MIKTLIIDGNSEGHLLTLPDAIPILRIPKIAELKMGVPILPDRTSLNYTEYKLAFKPIDGDLWLYSENGNSDVFLKRQTWVTKDKWDSCHRQGAIYIQNNNPFPNARNEKIERYKNLIKENCVAKQGFDLEGHLHVLAHA